MINLHWIGHSKNLVRNLAVAMAMVVAPSLSVAQTVDWTTAHTNIHLLPQATTSDSSGNVFVVYTQSDTYSPALKQRGPSVTESLLPNRSFVVVKYNSSGTAQWTREVESTDEMYIYKPVGIELDGSGNIFVGGSYWASFTPELDPIPDRNQFFMTKITSAGALSSTQFSATNSTPTDAVAMTADSTGEYVTGTKNGSMFTVKFNTSASGSATWEYTSSSAAGTCLTVSGSSLVVGGNVASGSGRDYKVWVLSTSAGSLSASGTYGINQKSGDTLRSVAVSSGGVLYGTGITQRVVSGATFNDATTVKYSSLSSLTTPSWAVTHNGVGAFVSPSGIEGTDGGRQVLVDPVSGDPIILATLSHAMTVKKLSASTGSSSWSTSFSETTGSMPVTNWCSEAIGMKLSSNNALFVFGTSWDSVYTNDSHYAVAKMTLAGATTWGPSWQYVSGQNEVVGSAMTVFTVSGTDYVGMTGGVYSDRTVTRVMH